MSTVKSKVERYYTMNLLDGRIIVATRETLTNPDYRMISDRIAKQVESGERDWRQLALKIRQSEAMKQEELMKRAEQEKIKNVHPTRLTRDNVQQFESILEPEEIGEVFDDDGDKVEKPGRSKGGKQGKPKEEAAPEAFDDDGDDVKI